MARILYLSLSMEPAAKKLCQTVSTAARNAKKIVVEGNIGRQWTIELD